MLVNKTVEFFLSEVADWGWRSAVSGSGLGQDTGDQITGQAADSERPGTGRDTGEGRGRDWNKMPVTKSHGQVADSERPGTGRDAGEGR